MSRPDRSPLHPRRHRSASPSRRKPLLRRVERSSSVPPRDRSLVPRRPVSPRPLKELPTTVDWDAERAAIDLSESEVPYEEPTEQELYEARAEYQEDISQIDEDDEDVPIQHEINYLKEQVMPLSTVPDYVLFDLRDDKLMFTFNGCEMYDNGCYIESWDHYVWIKGNANDPDNSLYAYVCTFVNTYQQLEDGNVVRMHSQWDEKMSPVINFGIYPITLEDQRSVVHYHTTLRQNQENFFVFTDQLLYVRPDQIGNLTENGRYRNNMMAILLAQPWDSTPSSGIEPWQTDPIDIGQTFVWNDDYGEMSLADQPGFGAQVEAQLPTQMPPFLQRPEDEPERPPFQQVMALRDFTDYAIHDDPSFSPICDRLVFTLSDDVDYDEQNDCYIEHWHVFGRINQSRDSEQNDMYAYVATIEVEYGGWTSQGPTQVSSDFSQQRLFPQTLDTDMYPTVDEEDQEVVDGLVERLNDIGFNISAPFERLREFIGVLSRMRSDQLSNPTFISTARDYCHLAIFNVPRQLAPGTSTAPSLDIGPVAQARAPVAQPRAPVAQARAPVAQPRAPVAQPRAPVAQARAPVAQARQELPEHVPAVPHPSGQFGEVEHVFREEGDFTDYIIYHFPSLKCGKLLFTMFQMPDKAIHKGREQYKEYWLVYGLMKRRPDPRNNLYLFLAMFMNVHSTRPFVYKTTIRLVRNNVARFKWITQQELDYFQITKRDWQTGVNIISDYWMEAEEFQTYVPNLFHADLNNPTQLSQARDQMRASIRQSQRGTADTNFGRRVAPDIAQGGPKQGSVVDTSYGHVEHVFREERDFTDYVIYNFASLKYHVLLFTMYKLPERIVSHGQEQYVEHWLIYVLLRPRPEWQNNLYMFMSTIMNVYREWQFQYLQTETLLKNNLDRFNNLDYQEIVNHLITVRELVIARQIILQQLKAAEEYNFYVPNLVNAVLNNPSQLSATRDQMLASIRQSQEEQDYGTDPSLAEPLAEAMAQATLEEEEEPVAAEEEDIGQADQDEPETDVQGYAHVRHVFREERFFKDYIIYHFPTLKGGKLLFTMYKMPEKGVHNGEELYREHWLIYALLRTNSDNRYNLYMYLDTILNSYLTEPFGHKVTLVTLSNTLNLVRSLGNEYMDHFQLTGDEYMDILKILNQKWRETQEWHLYVPRLCNAVLQNPTLLTEASNQILASLRPPRQRGPQQDAQDDSEQEDGAGYGGPMDPSGTY